MSGTELPRGAPLLAHALARPGSSAPQPSSRLPAAPGAWMERRLSTGPGPGARQGAPGGACRSARPPGRWGGVGEPECCSHRPPRGEPFVHRGAARLSPLLSTPAAACQSPEQGPCTQLEAVDNLTAGPRHPRSCLCSSTTQAVQSAFSKKPSRVSLVGQGLGIHPPVEGAQFPSLAQEDPTCGGTTEP